MKLVRAGLQRQVDRTRAGVADLRVVGGGLDLELFDRIRRAAGCRRAPATRCCSIRRW